MHRILALACVVLAYTVGHGSAQTRDETVVYALLGVESGEMLLDGSTKASFQVKRSDRKTIEVEEKVADMTFLIHIREEPECVFEISGLPKGPQRKVDFTAAYGARGQASIVGKPEYGLVGKNVECSVGVCSDFASLGQGISERHKRAVDFMRSKYCPGRAY